MKYPNVTLGRIEAVWNKLGGEEGVDRFLRSEVGVCESTRVWQEKDGVIYFTLPATDGMTGEGWIFHLESKGFHGSDYAKSVLRSPDFKPTYGVTYRIAVLKGMLFQDSDRTTTNIQAEADRRKFLKPHAEVACLIRDNFSDEEIEAMGLTWIINMADPINDAVGAPLLLGALRFDDGPWLIAYYAGLDLRWSRGYGFAFVVSQVSA